MRILFIMPDLAVGGGTSSLSSLYDAIKKDYEISVLLLTKQGLADVSYKNVIINPGFFLELFYSDFTCSRGIKKFLVGIFRLFSRLLYKFGINVEKMIAKKYQRRYSERDIVIPFGEGMATRFAQYFDNCYKSAWIHFEISKNPYSPQIEELYSKFDNVVVVSDLIAEQLGIKYPILAAKIVGIHNIVDVDRVSRLSGEDIPEMYEDNVVNIISIGRLSQVKRFSQIPSIALDLKKKGLKFKWRILGPECDISEKDALLSGIDNYNLSNEVEWLGNRTNPYPYLKKSDIFVMLSITEACPMVITEARILDVPIVSTDYKTSFEFINNGLDGIIAPIERISDEIFTLANNPERKQVLLDGSRLRGTGNEETIKRFTNLIGG